jgi:hypothetical protein
MLKLLLMSSFLLATTSSAWSMTCLQTESLLTSKPLDYVRRDSNPALDFRLSNLTVSHDARDVVEVAFVAYRNTHAVKIGGAINYKGTEIVKISLLEKNKNGSTFVMTSVCSGKVVGTFKNSRNDARIYQNVAFFDASGKKVGTLDHARRLMLADDGAVLVEAKSNKDIFIMKSANTNIDNRILSVASHMLGMRSL